MTALLRRGRYPLVLVAAAAAIVLPMPGGVHFPATSLFDADSETQIRISRTFAHLLHAGDERHSDARYRRSVEIGKMTPYEQRGGDVSIPAVRSDLRAERGLAEEMLRNGRGAVGVLQDHQ